MGYSSVTGPVYTAEDLNSMTVSAIKSSASSLCYSLTKIKKADIIDQFLEEQSHAGQGKNGA